MCWRRERDGVRDRLFQNLVLRKRTAKARIIICTVLLDNDKVDDVRLVCSVLKSSGFALTRKSKCVVGLASSLIA